MRERPILFSGPMVRALLDGRKTQTRRVVKKQPPAGWDRNCWYNAPVWGWTAQEMPATEWHKVRSPYGAPGDRLWVREAWRVGKPHDDTAPRDILPPLIERGKGVTVLYQAGGWRSVGPRDREEPVYRDDTPMPEWAGKARPPMFMPRAFSRITLEIYGVRVERLQDIDDADALAEGASYLAAANELSRGGWSHDGWYVHESARESFATLWNNLNAARGFGWEANPWVWVVEFKRIDA